MQKSSNNCKSEETVERGQKQGINAMNGRYRAKKVQYLFTELKHVNKSER